MISKKEASGNILELIEQFENQFKEKFEINKAISCNRGIPLGSLERCLEKDKKHYNGKRTIVLLKTDVVVDGKVGKITSIIKEKGYDVVKSKKIFLSEKIVSDFYDTTYYCKSIHEKSVKNISDFMAPGPSYAFVLEKEDCDNVIEGFKQVLSDLNIINDDECFNSKTSSHCSPHELHSAVHASNSLEEFLVEYNMLFKI